MARRLLCRAQPLFVRNVGHLMTNPAILDSDGNEVFEGIMDALLPQPARFTTFVGQTRWQLANRFDVYREAENARSRRSQYDCRSIRCRGGCFPSPTQHIEGRIMDEERRTTVNLAECIRRASERVVFILRAS